MGPQISRPSPLHMARARQQENRHNVAGFAIGSPGTPPGYPLAWPATRSGPGSSPPHRTPSLSLWHLPVSVNRATNTGYCCPDDLQSPPCRRDAGIGSLKKISLLGREPERAACRLVLERTARPAQELTRGRVSPASECSPPLGRDESASRREQSSISPGPRSDDRRGVGCSSIGPRPPGTPFAGTSFPLVAKTNQSVQHYDTGLAPSCG